MDSGLGLPIEPSEPGEEQEGDDFWERVATNLDARRMRLLFVADELPDELKRVVEFLNAQMPDIEALAVEIKQFRSASAQTLVPRVYGRLAKAPPDGGGRGPRTTITRERFLASIPDDAARETAEKILNAAQRAGARLEWGSVGVSIRTRCAAWYQPLTVAWLFPPEVKGWYGLTDITFGTGYALLYLEDSVRRVMKRHISGLAKDSFEKRDAWGDGLAWSVDYATAAANIDTLTERLAKVIADLQKLPAPEA